MATTTMFNCVCVCVCITVRRKRIVSIFLHEISTFQVSMTRMENNWHANESSKWVINSAPAMLDVDISTPPAPAYTHKSENSDWIAFDLLMCFIWNAGLTISTCKYITLIGTPAKYLFILLLHSHHFPFLVKKQIYCFCVECVRCPCMRVHVLHMHRIIHRRCTTVRHLLMF